MFSNVLHEYGHKYKMLIKYNNILKCEEFSIFYSVFHFMIINGLTVANFIIQEAKVCRIENFIRIPFYFNQHIIDIIKLFDKYYFSSSFLLIVPTVPL